MPNPNEIPASVAMALADGRITPEEALSLGLKVLAFADAAIKRGKDPQKLRDRAASIEQRAKKRADKLRERAYELDNGRLPY